MPIEGRGKTTPSIHIILPDEDGEKFSFIIEIFENPVKGRKQLYSDLKETYNVGDFFLLNKINLSFNKFHHKKIVKGIETSTEENIIRITSTDGLTQMEIEHLIFEDIIMRFGFVDKAKSVFDELRLKFNTLLSHDESLDNIDMGKGLSSYSEYNELIMHVRLQDNILMIIRIFDKE